MKLASTVNFFGRKTACDYRPVFGSFVFNVTKLIALAFLVSHFVTGRGRTRLLEYIFGVSENRQTDFCYPGNTGNCIEHGEDLIGRYRLSRQYDMAGCAIDGAMSTTLTAILCFLHDHELFLLSNRSLKIESNDDRFCRNTNEVKTLLDVREEIAIPRFVTVVRNPIDRFAASWQERCGRHSDASSSECYGCRSNITCVLEKVHERSLKYSLGQLGEVTSDDLHFFPQNWNCGLFKLAAQYHIIRLESGGEGRQTMENRLFSFLSKSGVEDSILEYIQREIREECADVGHTVLLDSDNSTLKGPFILFCLRQIHKAEYH